MGPADGAAPRLGTAMSDLNLAGRAGRWSADNWKKALFGWLIFAVAAMAIGSIVGHVQMRDSQYASGETAKAVRLLEHAGFRQPASEVRADPEPDAHGRGPDLHLRHRRRRADARAAAERHRTSRTRASSPAAAARSRATATPSSSSSRSRATRTRRRTRSKPILDAIAGVQQANPTLYVREVGNASANYELGKRFTKDFANAERMTVPITLIILLVSFGTVVAAGLPVLLAFSAVLASLGLYSLVTHGYAGDYQSVSSVVLLIGMAVGVDYSLFYLRREREERAAGQRAASRAAARGVDVGAGRRHLRRDGADRDGGDVHRGQPDLHLDGDRHDARRPLRGDRLGHGPGGVAVEARATASTGAASRSSGAGSTPPASRASGASCSTACCAGRSCSSSPSPGCCCSARRRR